MITDSGDVGWVSLSLSFPAAKAKESRVSDAGQRVMGDIAEAMGEHHSLKLRTLVLEMKLQRSPC